MCRCRRMLALVTRGMDRNGQHTVAKPGGERDGDEEEGHGPSGNHRFRTIHVDSAHCQPPAPRSRLPYSPGPRARLDMVLPPARRGHSTSVPAVTSIWRFDPQQRFTVTAPVAARGLQSTMKGSPSQSPRSRNVFSIILLCGVEGRRHGTEGAVTLLLARPPSAGRSTRSGRPP
jgi:hypothetical protein